MMTIMPKRPTISDGVRKAFQRVMDAGVSQGEVSRATGISAPQLSRFRHGERGLLVESLDMLGVYLKLEVKERGKRS